MIYYWIFQGSPKAAWLEGKDFIKVIQDAESLTWTAKQGRKDMEIGDSVILWMSGDRAGAVAEFMIAGKPFQDEAGDWMVDLWKIRNFEPVFPRSEMMKIIPDHQLIKARMGTNMALLEKDYQKIVEAMRLPIVDEAFIDKFLAEEPSENKPKIEDNRAKEEQKYIEGERMEKTLLTSKRNQKIVHEIKEKRDYTCEACGYKKEVDGAFIIDVHHKDGLAIKGKGEVKEADLLCLCPNCHRIAHSKGHKEKPLKLDEIQKIL
ncbi:putative HNH restriction endonuclease [Elusimicrobium posterum]|uniref:hypothetical protein n=1 Tax=Elusimicrobium posterum TaxID=3116653 RepID=UPI003C78EB6B